MDLLRRQHELILKETSLKYVRDIYNTIDWTEPLIGIKGARGVGKTTLMVQRILMTFNDSKNALYVSLDNLWFGNRNLIDLAEYALENGITHLFIDEIHKMKGWERQIKNLADIYSTLHIVFTGSSILEIDNSTGDLSRRLRLYDMSGLSFREYLNIQGHDFKRLDLQDILFDHQRHGLAIKEIINPLELLKKYLKCGYYPFFLKYKTDSSLDRIANIVETTLERDIPAVTRIEYETLQKAKHLLAIMAMESPSPLNASRTAQTLGINHAILIKLLYLLSKACIIRLLYYKTPSNPKAIQKPQKILFNNASMIYALGDENLGKIRETFVASMIGERYEIGYPKRGDLLVEKRYLLEIGGHKKSFEQIANLPDSFLVLDDIEVGIGNKIPMWLFGFIY